MKKLLRILSVLIVVASGTTTVLACKGKKTETIKASQITQGQDTARAVLKKISNRKIALPANTNQNTSQAITIQALKNSLQKANTALNTQDLKAITFAKDTLKDNEQNNSLKANINIGTTTASVALNVLIHSTAMQIRTKIKNPTTTIIAIPAGSNQSLSDANTKKALKTAIQNQYNLSDYDKNTISFPDASSTVLKDNQTNNSVKLRITDDATSPTTANDTLDKVQIHSTAKQIKTKLEDPRLGRLNASFVSTTSTLTGVNPDLIVKAVQANNPQLTAWDQAQLKITDDASITLTLQKQTAVKLKIIDDATPTPTTLTLTVQAMRFSTASEQYNVRAISDKIKPSLPIAIRAGSNQDITNPTTVTALKDSLQATNPALKADDLTKIDFSIPGGSLVNNEADNFVTAYIRDNSAVISFNLTVRIHSTVTQIENKLNAVGRFAAYFVNPNVQEKYLTKPNTERILTILKAHNPQLSAWDQSQLSITEDDALLLSLNTSIQISLDVKDDAKNPGSTQLTIDVARFTTASDKYQAYNTTSKIGSALVTAIPAGSNSDVTTVATRNAIRASLVAVNTDTNLTQAEVAKMTFTASPLKTGEANNNVNIRVTEPSGVKATYVLDKVQIHSTADEIKTDITNPTATIIGIPAGSSPTLSTKTTQEAIKQALKQAYNLSNYALSMISFPNASSKTLTTAEADNAVVLNITDDRQPTAGTASVTLSKVQIHRTKEEIQKLIADIPGATVDITGAGGDTGSGDIDTRIKNALQNLASNLTNWDITQIKIEAGVTINSSTATAVNLTISDDSGFSVVVQQIKVKSVA